MNTNSADTRWGSLAFVLVGALLGLGRIPAWGFVEHGAFFAGFFDAAQVFGIGVCLAAAREVSQTFSKLPPLGLTAAGSFVAIALGALFLQDDLDSFSRRQTQLPQVLVLWGSIAAFSQSVVLAAFVGKRLDRPKLRWVALGGAWLVMTMNGVVLQNDYRGIHLFLSLSSLVLCGAAFESARGRPAGLHLVPVLLAGSGFVVASGFIPVPARVSAALYNSTGAAFTPFFSWQDRSPKNAASRFATLHPEWFRSRAQHPPIPATFAGRLGPEPLVVLITVDALRTDVVLSRKYDELLPTLAKLRSEGVVFTQARAPGTLTKTSLSSLFMGKYFSQQYWTPMKRFNNAMTVHADKSVRFTEYLSNAGVHTANFRAVSWLRNRVVMRGFDYEKHIQYPKEKSYYTPSPPVFRALMPHLRKRSKKTSGAFIYAHLADPHAPYDQGRVKKGPAFDRYLSEVALVDSQLARLVRVLENLGSKRSVLLIVSADHGEAFGEHNSTTHGTTLYDEVLRVPMIFWRPDGDPRVVDEPVSLIDLGPTILDVFGQSTPGSFMGQSLAPFLFGEDVHLTRPIVAETRLMQTLVTPEHLKVIVDTRTNRIELYDLERDPEETLNLADDLDLLKEPLGTLKSFFDAHTLTRDGYRPPYVR